MIQSVLGSNAYEAWPACAKSPGSATASRVEWDAVDDGSLRSQRMRVNRILAQKIEFIPSKAFEDTATAEEILQPMPGSDNNGNSPVLTAKAPPGTPSYLAALYAIPLLTAEQERYLFRKMNYLKFRASVLRDQLDPNYPRKLLLNRIETLLSEAMAIRNQIVRANLRLVVSIAKTVIDRANGFEEMVSDGNLPLIRAAEIFDFERGTRFSTYATWAIRNSLYRATSRNRRIFKRFLTGSDGVFESIRDVRQSARAQERFHTDLRGAIQSMLSRLDSRDQAIVISRFGLDKSGRPRKFREIAEQLNISTERVRQLLARSLNQMHQAVDQESIELP